jgi:DNA-binding phage protein
VTQGFSAPITPRATPPDEPRPEVFGGVPGLAQQSGLNATTLYRTLSENGNPELCTLRALLEAMGLRLSIAPAS